MQHSRPVAREQDPGRLERRVFFVAVGVMALHVVDDSFVQPQPGTSAGDHLLSGLVPLGVLALAAVAYPRVRGGARAAIALVLGVFGIALGIEGAHYTLKASPTGDDFTSLLCLPAGVALLGLALVTLWRTRRRDGGLVRRSLRRLAIGAATLIALVFVLFPLSFAYVITHVARAPEADIDLGGADAEAVKLHTSDGLTLHGSYVPSRNGAAVIVAFGRKKTQPHARMLIRHGYGVLIFDRRGEGDSDGDPNAFAWNEGELDVRAAAAFLKKRRDVDPDRIGGLGLSVGGETLLQAAARRDDLQAVVSEGASSRSVGELRSVSGADLGATVMTAGITAGTALFADAAPPPHLRDLVPRISPRAMLLIYATKGTGGEEHTANRAFYRAGRRAQGHLGDPRGRARGRPRGPAARVRAARHPLLRPPPRPMSAP